MRKHFIFAAALLIWFLPSSRKVETYTWLYSYATAKYSGGKNLDLGYWCYDEDSTHILLGTAQVEKPLDFNVSGLTKIHIVGSRYFNVFRRESDGVTVSDEINKAQYEDLGKLNAGKPDKKPGQGIMLQSMCVNPLQAAIAKDSTSSATGGASSVSSLTFAHVCTGSNLYLLVGTSIGSGSTLVSSVTYNSVNLTQFSSQLSANIMLDSWGLKAPATGSHNIVATFNKSKPACAVGISFTGVDQTTPTGTAAAANGSGTTLTVNVSSASGEMVSDFAHHQDDARTLTVGAGQAEYRRTNTAASSEDTRIATSVENGAVTTTMSWTISGASAEWAVIGVPLKPASAAAPTVRRILRTKIF